MVEEDLGEATIAYEDPDEGTVERTVENEHVAYFQDHWILKTGENERGEDVIRRIPIQRVHYVERSVEQFEQEIRTLRDQVQSFADDLRSRLLGGGDGGRGGGPRGEGEAEEVYHIDVESGEAEEAGTTPGGSSGPSESGGTGTSGSGGTGTGESGGAGMDDEELTGAETDEDEMSDGGTDGADDSGGPGR